MVKFNATPEELAIMKQIAKRAERYAFEHGGIYLVGDAVMDLDATHSNGNALRLEELLKADEFNFSHDMFGIRRHLCRSTGKLQNCFVPRFTKYVTEFELAI